MPLNSHRHQADDRATSDLPVSAEEFLALNDNSPTAPNGAANDNVAHDAVTLHQGCCLEVMKAIPARSVHLILADLPYGTTACSWDSIIDLGKLWEEFRRIITPTGVIVLTAAQPFTTILAASNLGWLKESLVWEKSRATGFLQSKKRHLKKHEDILVFSPGTVVSGKGRQTARNMTYNPQGLVELERPVRSRNGNMKGGTLNYSGGHNTLSPIYRPCYIKPNIKRNGEPSTFNGKPITGDGRNQTHTNYPTSILRFASERKTVHPTQKPVALMEYLVRTYSNDGDTVLDNCMGSGTTGVACANVGNRHFVGVERDPKYFAMAEPRIAAAHNQVPEPPPIPVAANDDAPTVGPDEQDEIVRRVQAVIAVPKRTKAVKVPAWKVRQGGRRQARKDTRRVIRLAGRAVSQENHVTAERNPPMPKAMMLRTVAPASTGRLAAANDHDVGTSVTIHQGDCLQAMRSMADGSVDLIVTSPPYNLGTSTGNGFRGKIGGKWKNAALKNGYASYSDDMPDQAYVEWLKTVISECWRLIPDDGAIFFNHKPRVQGGICLLPTRFLPPEVILRQEIIWARSGGMNFNQSFFLPTHERVLVLAKPKFRLKKGASGIGDVWTIPQERNNTHPAPFPLELPRRCIAATNAKVIFDPFTGSGTTGVAAQLEGRDFIGCELDPGYLEMACERLGLSGAQPRAPDPDAPPSLVAANDDVSPTNVYEEDEIVARVHARKAGRKEARRGDRLERQAQPPEMRHDPLGAALVPMANDVEAVTPSSVAQQLAANENRAAVTVTLCNSVIKTDVVTGLKKLPDRSIDIIISDPPYNIGKDFGICKDKMVMDEYIAWCNDWIVEGMRVLKPTGTFYIYGFSEILAYLLVHSKADFKRWLVWHYTNKNSVKSTFWQRSHESILVLSHQDPHFNVDAARERYTKAYKRQVGKTRKGTLGRFGNTETLYGGHPGGAQGRDVIKHPALAGGAGAKERVAWCETCSMLLVGSREKAAHKGHELTEHETQKPLGLTRRLIATAKNPEGVTNAVVLFSGTGAESVALEQEGCNFVAFDINDTYVKMGNAWIERFAPKPKPQSQRLLGGRWKPRDFDETKFKWKPRPAWMTTWAA